MNCARCNGKIGFLNGYYINDTSSSYYNKEICKKCYNILKDGESIRIKEELKLKLDRNETNVSGHRAVVDFIKRREILVSFIMAFLSFGSLQHSEYSRGLAYLLGGLTFYTLVWYFLLIPLIIFFYGKIYGKHKKKMDNIKRRGFV